MSSADKVCPERFIQIGGTVERICFTFSAFARFESRTGKCLFLGEAADLTKPFVFRALLEALLPERQISPSILKKAKTLHSEISEALEASTPPEDLQKRLHAVEQEISEIIEDLEWGKPKEEPKEDGGFDWLVFMANGAALLEVSPQEFLELTPAQFFAFKYQILLHQKSQLEKNGTGGERTKELDFDSLLARMPASERERVNGNG